jgi:hypothetical protein
MGQHLHLIELKLQRDLKNKGTKVKLTSLRFPSDTVTFSGEYRLGLPLEQSVEILETEGFKIVGWGFDEKNKKWIIASTTFEPLKPLKNLGYYLSENYFPTKKTTRQKPTLQKPTKRIKKCI